MIFTLLTLLQNRGAPPPTPVNPFTGDIVAGDYSAIPKKFKLQGEVKRKRLPKSVVKKAKKLAESQPNIEQVKEFSQVAIPQAAPFDIAHLATQILAGIELALNAYALQHHIEQQAIAERQAQELRQRVIIEQIAEFMRVLEEDEMLITYLM